MTAHPIPWPSGWPDLWTDPAAWDRAHGFRRSIEWHRGFPPRYTVRLETIGAPPAGRGWTAFSPVAPYGSREICGIAVAAALLGSLGAGYLLARSLGGPHGFMPLGVGILLMLLGLGSGTEQSLFTRSLALHTHRHLSWAAWGLLGLAAGMFVVAGVGVYELREMFQARGFAETGVVLRLVWCVALGLSALRVADHLGAWLSRLPVLAPLFLARRLCRLSGAARVRALQRLMVVDPELAAWALSTVPAGGAWVPAEAMAAFLMHSDERLRLVGLLHASQLATQEV